MVSFVRGINAWAQRRPLAAAVVSTTFKAWSADLMIQTLVERRETIDKRRSLLFASFGFFYQAGFQYWMYNKLWERLWPATGGIRNAFKKVAATNLIADPVFFFPTFYTMKEVMNGTGNYSLCFTTGLANYRQNILNDWKNSWAIWVPAHSITYTVCPKHLRFPWIACVSFVYVAILSFTRGCMNQEGVALGDDIIGQAGATPQLSLSE